MTSNPDPDFSDQPLSDHIAVSGLVQKVLDHFSVHTVSDICRLDIDVVAKEKGVGVKKVETIRALIQQAHQLAGFTPRDSRSERIQQVSSDSRLDQPLVYVPSFLKESFRRLEIDTVSKLICLDEGDLATLPSWGEKKSVAALALRGLYQSIFRNNNPDPDAPLSALVPKAVLPDNSLASQSLQSFIESSNQPSLKGKAIQETLDLRSLLRFWIHGDKQDDELAELDWRDVPLQVNSRVRDFLDRHSLRAIGDLEQLATRGWLTHPQNGSRVSALDSENFGGSSLESLRNEVLRLKADGLQKYRGNVICDIENFEISSWDWDSVPLRLRAKAQSLLRKCEVNKIAEVHRAAVRSQLPCPETATWKNVGELDGFTEAIVEELRRELNRLAKSGLAIYRFGEGGPPKDAREFVVQARELLDSRAVLMLQSYLEGRTFDDIGVEYKITRSRAQQVFSTSLKKLHVFQDVANTLLEPVLPLLDQRLYVPIHELAELTQCKEDWEVKLLIAVSEFDWSTSDARGVSQFASKTIDDLYRALKTLANGTSGFELSEIKTVGDLVNSYQPATEKQSDLTARLSGIAEKTIPLDACRLLLGEDWVKTFVRAQLVSAGVNGLAFDQIDTGGFVRSASELAALLGSDADHLEDGRFRRPGALYSRADELVIIIRDAGNSIGIEEIVQKSERKWHQSVLVGRYLSQLHSILTTARGQYIHIDALGISLEEVQAIANWGEELLAGEKKTIDGEDLFDLFSSSQFANKLSNAYQLVSVVAKHPDVRRLSNNLQLAHRDSFDVSELSLEKADPEIASQWHPTKNGNLTPADVRPNSFKPRWWMCEQQHEFEAMPVYRTRMVRSCPGCQERWNLEKLRHFVTSLRQHLDTFTPAELYVIFQQSGLLNRGGRAKGFVKSLATGRFPRGELDKFIAGEESLVDEFISDDEIDLESLELLAGDDDNLSDSSDKIETSEPAPSTPQKLPEVTAKAALDAMDSPVIASTDAEAAEFLVASAKAKVWSHAFRDEEAALSEVNTPHESEYGSRVKTEFLHEYSEAKSLETPNGYSFSISGKITQPNLMQRHVAAEVRDRLRFGNWSGTGAGKTLSAVLATRVCNASLTVVCCPNAVVGSEQSGWRGEIQSIFPDSDVAFKTWEPIWRSGSTHKYLVMNYEQFQQPGSEAQLKRFLDHNEIDFIVIDEVHYAKQRYADQMSQRKRLLQAMVAAAGKKNPQLRVLGLSATPVINNLQEGRSLIEMITGVEHDDLPTNASVPNCMRLHQQLATLGTRWRPEYEASLKIETPELDCSGALDEILSLGTNPSPLQIEKILTQVRIPEILKAIKRPGRSLVYTHYVDQIDKLLYEAITNAGFRCGFYTGESKEGLEPFKDGTLDVLIGSSSIGTGVDGLQHVCDRLIINSLPWTNAEYEQLIGRIWRQGQASATVEVIVPVTYANIGGERWSYCGSKLQRIRYKKSIADAAVDGAVPEGNLRTPAQAQKDVLEWLKRLEAGKEQTVERRTIVVPLSDFGDRAEKRRARYGDFSTMNNRWNAANSATLATRLIENPEEWEQYHTLYRKARESWPVVPFEEVVRWCNKREGYIVADFGCGEAMLAKAIIEKHIVHSFDHVAIDDTVIQCDMSKTPLDDESVDVAVFSLSLMGNNFTDYMREAHRILKIDGHLHIWEAESRFDDVKRFASDIEKLGFQIFKPKSKSQFVHFEGRKTERSPDKGLTLSFRE